MVPYVYRKLAFDSIARMKHGLKKVQLHEYHRPGWQYHAKGMWFRENGNFWTLIGSPNYGYRSQERDLELQFAMVTGCKVLQDSLQQEVYSLFDYAYNVQYRSEESFLVSLSSKLCREWL